MLSLFLFLIPLTTGLFVNVTRLQTHLTTLATHNDLTPPAVQRILYTPADVSSRTYLKSLFGSAGLETREDALGNIFATWRAARPGVLTGSHFDAIPNSGMFDGTLGILSALEAVMALKQSGFVPRRSITIIAFTSEEPTRFGLSCIGSRVLSGVLPPANLTGLKDSSGIPFNIARTSAGYTGDVATVPLSPEEYVAFIELHSEQGPLLENSATEIGAVTSIAAPAALLITFTGPGGHAGTTLMRDRHDPSLAASELSLSVEAAVARYGGVDTVGTTGYIEITPNAINSVPTAAKVGVDVRDILQKRRDRVLAVIESAARLIAKRRDVGVEIVVNSRDPPAKCDEHVVEAVVDVAKEHGLSVKKMVSRAYHDALFMAGVMPTGMIFVPCRGGVSHRPDEFVAQADMERGVQVLAGVLKRLVGDADEGKWTEQSAEAEGLVEDSGEVVEESLTGAAEDDMYLEYSESEDEDGGQFTESSGTGSGESMELEEARDEEFATSTQSETRKSKAAGSKKPAGARSRKVSGTDSRKRTDAGLKKAATKSSRKPADSSSRASAGRGSRKPASTGSRKPTSTGSRKPTSKRSRKPTSMGSSDAASTAPAKPTTMGLRKPTATGLRKPSATGSRKLTATSSRRPAASGSRRPAAAGSRRPAAAGSRRPAAAGSRRPAAAGSRRPAAAGSRRPVATGSKRPAATGSRRRATTGSRRRATTGSRKKAVSGSRKPSVKGMRQPKVTEPVTEDSDEFDTEYVEEDAGTASEVLEDWDIEGFDAEEHNFEEEKDEV